MKLGDEVALQYYRPERVHAGPIDLKQGDAQAIKSPSEVGTGKAKGEKAPLSENPRRIGSSLRQSSTECSHGPLMRSMTDSGDHRKPRGLGT